MPRKQIDDMIEELRSWLPNYDHGPKDYPILLFRILASLPGGDELEDMGYETFNLGWHEMEQLARVLDTIQDKTDVEDLVHGLIYEEEEEEDLDEARRRPHKEEWWIHWHDSGSSEGPFEKREYAADWAAAERERGRGRYTIRRGDPDLRPTEAHRLIPIDASQTGPFQVTPQDQGQAIEVAYAATEGGIVRRITSATSIEYAYLDWSDYDGRFEPQNGEVPDDGAAWRGARMTGIAEGATRTQEAHAPAPAHRPAWPTAAAPRKKAPRRKKAPAKKKTRTRRRR